MHDANSEPSAETRVKGVYKPKDFADRIQTDFQQGIARGDSCGWESLNETYLVKRGHWTVLTGIPNHGKSTWLDNVMVNMAKQSNWKFLVCSPENQPIERHIESLIEIHAGKRFANESQEFYAERCITPREIAESLAFINDHFCFIYPDETDFNIDYILELAKAVKETFDFDGFVVDPYNELEHKRPAGWTETEYISAILTKFRRFQRAQNSHGWLVAHPTKLKEIIQTVTEKEVTKGKIYAMPSLYDIAGAAHWRNKADMGVVVYRDFTRTPEKTIISVQKVRFRESGKMGQVEFYYDAICNRFVENESDLAFFRLRKQR
jgi:twinkle protein